MTFFSPPSHHFSFITSFRAKTPGYSDVPFYRLIIITTMQASDEKKSRRRKWIHLQQPGPYYRPAKKKEPKPVPEAEKIVTDQAPAAIDVAERRVKPWTQCFKCQRWGHLSYDCQNSTRCLKCGQEHRASECTKPPDVEPTCANCHLGHTSNYRGCKAAPKRKRAKRPKKKFHSIPGIPQGTVGKLFRTIPKLLTRTDFFTAEQLEFIAKEMTDPIAPMETQAPPTPAPETKLIPRVIVMNQDSSKDPPPISEEKSPLPSGELPATIPEETQAPQEAEPLPMPSESSSSAVSIHELIPKGTHPGFLRYLKFSEDRMERFVNSSPEERQRKIEAITALLQPN